MNLLSVSQFNDEGSHGDNFNLIYRCNIIRAEKKESKLFVTNLFPVQKGTDASAKITVNLSLINSIK